MGLNGSRLGSNHTVVKETSDDIRVPLLQDSMYILYTYIFMAPNSLATTQKCAHFIQIFK